jgi:polyphosphate glucokinase
MRTLCIDVGGTGIKAIVLDAAGQPLTERVRVKTPQPATPEAVVAAIDRMGGKLGAFDRISLGFPGVVHDGVTRTAPHLDPSWAGFPLQSHLAARTGDKPVRVLNDAVIHGLGVIERRGLETVITLGTGLGCCLYNDGCPFQLELGHHPYGKGRVYEELLGDAALKEAGPKKWNSRVRKAIRRMEALFNYQRLYVGGGNARLLEREGLPANVSVVDNDAGLLGGIRVWT